MVEKRSSIDESGIPTSATDERATVGGGRLADLGRRGIAFYTALVVFTLFIAGLVGQGLVAVFTFWFGVPAQFGGLEFVEAHRLHFIVRSAFGWAIIAALLALFWRPKQSLGAVYQLTVFILTFIAVVLLSAPGVLTVSDWASLGLILVLTAAVAGFHPARDQLRDGLRLSRLSRPLAVLAVIAAVPLLGYAANQLSLQQTNLAPGATGEFAEHVFDFHFGDMVVASVLILALALVASLRPSGWLLPAVTAGLLAIVLGLASALFPTLVSSVGVTWGVLAVAWGLVFIGTAMVERSAGRTSVTGRSKPATEESVGR